jgi:nucleotide-binding universal stress UspA family protein
MYEHLLVPVDGGHLSEHAMAASLKLAKKLGASITGFIAEPSTPLPGSLADQRNYKAAVERHDIEVAAHAKQVLSRFEELAREAGVPFQGLSTQSGRVEDAIVAAAEERGCDLIVMTKRDLGAFGEAIWGSHTKKLVSRTNLPVLVLH